MVVVQKKEEKKPYKLQHRIFTEDRGNGSKDYFRSVIYFIQEYS